MKKLGMMWVGLFVVLVVGAWLWIPRSVKAQNYCTGGNVCFCDPDATCCGETDNCFPQPSGSPPPGGGGTWTCFGAGTKVKMESGEQKNIEEVVVGERVISQDETGARSVSTVTKLDQPIREHMCNVSFESGREVKMTDEHPLYTREGWKAINPGHTARENPDLIVTPLQTGDKVVREEGGVDEIKKIACWSKKTPAYNLILDSGMHTYFADGYLAHNKDSVCLITKVDCPAGTVKGTTLLSSWCTPGNQVQCIGSAQTYMGTCNCYYDDQDRYICGAKINTYNCVQACSNTAPSAPVLSSPANGASVSTTSVTLMWNAMTSWGTACSGQNRQFKVYVWEKGTTAPTTPNTTIAAGTTRQYVFTGVRGKTYRWKVVADNGPLATQSSVWEFSILSNQVTGSVYYDPNNTCSTTVPWNLGAGMNVSLRGTSYSANVSGTNGAWSITANPATYSYLDLAGIPAGYECSSCASCPAKNGVVVPSATNNFFIRETPAVPTADQAWWQGEGAGIYAGGTLRSILPSSSMYLILKKGLGSEGALIVPNTTPEIGSGSVSEQGWLAKSLYRGKRMDYQYFASNMGVSANQVSDWPSSDVFNLNGYPSTAEFGYMKPDSGTAIIDDILTVGVGEKYVIFVDGELVIRKNITVADGGFLALIVRGGITIDPTVTNLQGIFITNGNFVTESQYSAGVIDDNQLTIEGNVISWSQVLLNRNVGSLANVNTPSEKFSFRADLLLNMPAKMKMFVMQWSEVLPGTFGN